ncbi:MAG: hypothetical protein HKN23_14755 [Verrucomicrobiales bacterium]|nr:hypothetical protein [Verrucomicrobiales bacterium]
MKRKRLVQIGGGIFGLVAIAIILWFGVFTSADSREFAAVIREWHEKIEPETSGRGPALSSSLTFAKTGGIPKELEQRTAEFSYQWPDKLFLSAEVDGESYHIARDGQEVRLFVPYKDMAIVGANDVPRFSANPESIDSIELADFSLPVSSSQLLLLPALVKVEKSLTQGMEPFYYVTPKPLAAKKLGLPEGVTFSLLLDYDTKHPRSIRVQDDNELDVQVWFSEWDIDENPDARIGWKQVDGDLPNPERVALSHLAKFVEVTLKNLNSRAEPLPPEKGERELVARSGDGRLEIWDGTRVLWLKGTPEEMGTQHGELLAEEIREVTDRILYGIGVGSSFGKGRWFFGEIEEAESRLHPHTDPRFFREMDALALASGLEIEECRLSNFFPELFHCSGFAVHGSATVDGKIYHGRVLDYMRGVGLEQNAVVMIVQPDEGNAWVNVGYAGFIGTVTAMNEKQIAIGEMGGRGEGNWDGKPMAQLMREVMEKADTIDEAFAIMERGPRTCEYYYVISDAKSGRAVGIAATPETFETIWSGETHPQLPHAVEDTVLMSAGDRYEELVKRVKAGHGTFTADSARELMTRPVCMTSNIQSVLFAPDTLDFWVANADSENVASHTRYTKYNLQDMLKPETDLTQN